MGKATRRRNGTERRWRIGQAAPAALRGLEGEGGFSPLLARVLLNRGLASLPDARRFLDARLADFLSDPFGLKDMDRAADRLADAVRSGEPLAIFGDYDVDGITATVLLLRLLRWLGADPHYYIPHRVDEGYGLSCEAIDSLAAKGVRLLVTVDNGITSFAEIAHATSLGLDCVVTDHHRLGDHLPSAWAVVNPNRPDCTYVCEHLSGVGVAFKLAHALLRRLGVEEGEAKAFLSSMLDLVALGTVADVVPLVGENRALVRAGLARLERTENPGLAALLELCDRGERPLQTETVTFYVAPRLNAAGRTEHASLAVELLTTSDPEHALELAHQLDELNDRRRVIERRIFDEGLLLVQQQCDLSNDLVYVVLGSQWHLGVVGIVASKMSDHFGRPVVVLSEFNGLARGSARSTPSFDVFAALTECSDILESFGGHRQAAGLSLAAERVASLRERLNVIAAHAMGEEAVEELAVDAVCLAEDLSVDAVSDLEMLEPCGYGNPKPIFALAGATVIREPRIVGTNHLKFAIAAGHENFDVIGFGMADTMHDLRQMDGPLDIAFWPTISTWGGTPRVELQLCDFRRSVVTDQ